MWCSWLETWCRFCWWTVWFIILFHLQSTRWYDLPLVLQFRILSFFYAFIMCVTLMYQIMQHSITMIFFFFAKKRSYPYFHDFCTMSGICMESPCINGNCEPSSSPANYTCRCNVGYHGRDCEIGKRFVTKTNIFFKYYWHDCDDLLFFNGTCEHFEFSIHVMF